MHRLSSTKYMMNEHTNAVPNEEKKTAEFAKEATGNKMVIQVLRVWNSANVSKQRVKFPMIEIKFLLCIQLLKLFTVFCVFLFEISVNFRYSLNVCFLRNLGIFYEKSI